MMKVWKISKVNEKGDEVFSMGGTTPRFGKNGKTWNTKAHLRSHLINVDDLAESYSDCQIIEYELVTTKLTNVSDELTEYAQEFKHNKEQIKKDRDVA